MTDIEGQQPTAAGRKAMRRAARCAASATILLAARSAMADVVIGQDWNPVSNTNGYTYFDGFTDYADGQPVTLIQQVNRNGNNWLQYSNNNGQYWGQLTAQMWANSAVSPANLNANPHLEFDVDLSQYTWGRLFVRFDYGNNGGALGTQAGTVQIDLSHLVAKNKATISATPNPFIEHVSMDLSSLLPRDETATGADFSLFLQPNFWGYWDADANNFVSQPYAAQTFFLDNVRLTTDPVKINAGWNVDADGSWLANQTSAGTATWAGGIPNGAGHTANFMAVTNYDTGQNTINAHTVTVDGPVTVGVLDFNNPNSYTLSGPGSITLQGATGVAAAINVGLGNHTIAAPLTLADDTTVTVQQAASGVTLSALQPSTHALTKAGPGALNVNNVRASQLAVNGGRVSVIPDGTSNGVSRVGGLTVASGATLDLNNNHLVVDYSGASPLSDIRSQIISGYAGGSWNGTGLTSSAAAAAASSPHKTALGYGEASVVLGGSGGTFAGQSVDGTTVLVRYTYSGDANLDGKVDTLDFNNLAANFGGTNKVWTQADFNYDGVVDTLDFNNLAANFGQQLSDGGGGGAGALVPEPTAIVALAAGGLLIRQRRRC